MLYKIKSDYQQKKVWNKCACVNIIFNMRKWMFVRGVEWYFENFVK